MKYIASVSFGKDSLAMLLRLLEEKYPLDEVVYFDIGVEFQSIRNNAEKTKAMLDDKGIKFTILEPKEHLYTVCAKSQLKRQIALFRAVTNGAVVVLGGERH